MTGKCRRAWTVVVVAVVARISTETDAGALTDQGASSGCRVALLAVGTGGRCRGPRSLPAPAADATRPALPSPAVAPQ